jgi:predicted TIM-barrel fold metal-dependent hydrolase
VTAFVRSDAVEKIRAEIDHPIVDADGHYLEFMPLVLDILREIAGSDVVERYQKSLGRGGHLPVRGFWGLPEKATLDRMTATLPELLYRRLDELGIDFAILYPTPGPIVTHPDDELRQAVCRAINLYSAEVYAPYRDRLAPAALIPTYTPEEAVAELDHAVGGLGMKITRMDGAIPRNERPDGTKASWVDTLGHDSLYDYDPVWAKCLELGVVASFHGVGFGWGSRVSSRNYVHNHVGSFAAAQEAVCRSLVMGGAPRRFPDLRFAFLEGGVAWAAQLYGDLLSHYEKRNKDAVRQYDPAQFDVELARELFRDHARGRIAERLEPFEDSARKRIQSRQSLAVQGDSADVDSTDDFADSGIECAADFADVFGRQLFFGCEADDPLTAMAFARDLLPGGISLGAVFSSDIGHWDVPDMRKVLPEAWELVENGHLDPTAFRAFTCDNAARMLTAMDPRFFDGTVLEGAVLEGTTDAGAKGAR